LNLKYNFKGEVMKKSKHYRTKVLKTSWICSCGTKVNEKEQAVECNGFQMCVPCFESKKDEIFGMKGWGVKTIEQKTLFLNDMEIDV
jgi:hypothetical protein